jgi:hypothetical protein
MRIKAGQRWIWQGLLALALAPVRAAASPAAEIQFDPAASTAFPTLAVPVGVRATGMGDVYTAVGDDIYALRWNPAGLAKINSYQIAAMDNEWSSTLGLRQDFFGYGQPLANGALGVGLDYFNLGQLDQRDDTGALLGRTNASALGLSLGYAQPIWGPAVKGGVALEALQQTLYGSSEWGGAVTLGVLWDFMPDWSVGMSLDHLGSAGGASTPAVYEAGLSSKWFERTLILAADAEVPLAGSTAIKAGGELAYGDLRFRAGWRQVMGDADADQQTGMTAGVGFKIGMLTLDYSYVPYGTLSTVNRAQFTIDLPRDFFQPHQAYAEGTTASAQAYFDAAQGFEKQGDVLKALIQYQRAQESYPREQRSHPLPFYAIAVKKIDDLQNQLRKGGDHSQIQKLTLASLAGADADLQAGHYKEAIARLEQARKLDPNSAPLAAKLKLAQASMEARLAAFRAAAQAGAQANNLSAAVENYRKILGVDPGDAEALDYLTQHRAALKTLLQSIDRKAIYLYVAGNLEDAIKAWSEGEALDQFGDVDFKRNLDKAHKQLELREQK